MTPVRLGLLTAVFALQACSSSSDSDPAISAQAVDGYLFGSAVSCDGVDDGFTGLAGELECPAGTELMSATGGLDVGFDETATTGIEFTGTVSGPAGLDYLTPLSTLVVALSTDDEGKFDAAIFEDQTSALASAFGQPGLDLNSSPVTTLQTVKLNAQLHQVLSAFAENPDSYRSAVIAFAQVVKNAATTGSSLNVATGVAAVLTQINDQLEADPVTAGLALAPTELDARIVSVGQSNQEIDGAQSPIDVVPVAGKAASALAALTLNRDLLNLELMSEIGEPTRPSLSGFESAALSGGSYTTVLSTSLTGLAYDRNVMKVNRDLVNDRASIGFQMKSTTAGDARSLTYFTDDAYFSATQGDSSSLKVVLREDAKLYVSSVSKGGAERNTTIVLGKDHAFTNDNGNINVNVDRVRAELAAENIDDVLDSNGNYEVTFAIGGLRVNSESAGTARANGARTLVANGQSMTGTGIQGYVTVVDAD